MRISSPRQSSLLSVVVFLLLVMPLAAESLTTGDAERSVEASTNGSNTDNGSAALPPALSSWQDVIRQSPYWVSQGMHVNLQTIRRWVLNNESFCSDPDRHILFDHRATFLGYLTNGDTREETQKRLNTRRSEYVTAGRTASWTPGGAGSSGYPFALNCNQPDARLRESLARYTGEDESAQLWGTWDGMTLGSSEQKLSLHETIQAVYQDRYDRGRISMPAEVLSTLAGKTIIESGGLRNAHSAAGARGIMQLSLAALNDCGLAERHYYHRLAQIDCALRLLEQNHRNLEPVFLEKFGHLPEAKADALYSLLLIQAYHGGVGRVSSLMTHEDYSRAAQYFAAHHERFSAGDIALGMIFHNMGRNQLGFASLYYVIDVSIATNTACAALTELTGCELD